MGIWSVEYYGAEGWEVLNVDYVGLQGLERGTGEKTRMIFCGDVVEATLKKKIQTHPFLSNILWNVVCRF
jgi:hypothetical protein